MEPSINRMKGTVSWFDGRRGFGFITPEYGEEDLFVHYSSIKAVGYRSLDDGEAVEFVISVDDYGRTRAVDVTGHGGGFVKGGRYGGGDVGRGSDGSRGFVRSCYRCGEVGHVARNCSLGYVGYGGIGPCYSCGEMGHFARECPGKRWSFEILSSSSMASLIDAEKDDSHTLFPLYGMDPSDEEEDVGFVAEHVGTEKRNWAELPRDVLTVIFKKIAAIEVLMSAQFVCKPWRQVSREPELWRCTDMRNHSDLFNMIDMVSMAKEAVDRSQGRLEEFYAEYFGDDDLMLYIAERTTILRSLRLIAVHYVSEEVLAQVLKRFPLLEELEITLCSFSDDVVKFVGPACPQLKSFQLNTWAYRFYDDFEFEVDHDSEALELAKHMRLLRRLQLFGSKLTNVGLFAILDNCPYLEHLDLRRCLYVNYDENLKKKCAKIKELRYPNDSVTDYPYDATIGGCGHHDDYVPTSYDSEFEFLYDDFDEYDLYDGYDDLRFDCVFEDML